MPAVSCNATMSELRRPSCEVLFATGAQYFEVYDEQAAIIGIALANFATRAREPCTPVEGTSAGIAGWAAAPALPRAADEVADNDEQGEAAASTSSAASASTFSPSPASIEVAATVTRIVAKKLRPAPPEILPEVVPVAAPNFASHLFSCFLSICGCCTIS